MINEGQKPDARRSDIRLLVSGFRLLLLLRLLAGHFRLLGLAG
jgi:hypothetical protein